MYELYMKNATDRHVLLPQLMSEVIQIVVDSTFGSVAATLPV